MNIYATILKVGIIVFILDLFLIFFWHMFTGTVVILGLQPFWQVIIMMIIGILFYYKSK